MCIGDEFNLLFICTHIEIVNLREKFIPLFYRNNPSMYKTKLFMDCFHKSKIGVNLSKFLKYCNQIK